MFQDKVAFVTGGAKGIGKAIFKSHPDAQDLENAPAISARKIKENLSRSTRI